MHNEVADKKSSVARLSVLSNTFLVLGKLIVGILIGSVSVISEGIHSGIDLLAAVIAYFAVKKASKPADIDHPYGHGKYENVSGTVEAILIFMAAIIIVYEAIGKLVKSAAVEEVGAGLIVMAISALVNVYVSRRLMQVAKETDSIALQADALHLKTDVYTSIGVFAGLGLIKLTGISIIDPIAAIVVALLIIKEAWHLSRNAVDDLLDMSLSEAEMDKITSLINAKKPNVLEYHKLRTRKVGAERQIDLHLVVASDISVKESHELCDSLEEDFRKLYPGSTTVIHVEPCAEDCENCPANSCSAKCKKYSGLA